MSAHESSREGYDFAHPLPLPLLFAVFGALVVLTIITVAQASFEFGNIDILIVMAIATVKALLVAAFFMHLAYDKPFNILCFLAAFVFVALFIVATFLDNRWTNDSDIPVMDDAIMTEPASQA